ncbi:Protein transport protein SEC31 [Neolecta irregularis DAH-3]|uniref:Protein transport protein SEC31 n=1 Tax=Neolecta irregularis (strain DAH-3) TaxID=1198029 RepID=A0A1U7LNF5_NEOID|nr:Protein transport protein SEC31 [Neolecta irregularis DAH-3]|eukprot:OLL24196.1 Protein transport protein SEC31 [Neolecta irregularis DAH-3]
METGTVDLWSPKAVLNGLDPESCLVARYQKHTSYVKSVQFNPSLPNALASGGGKGEIWVWDLGNPDKPYALSSRRLDDIDSVAWNPNVPHILATGGSSGHTVIWDVKLNRERMTLYAQSSSSASSARQGVSAVAWNPTNSTKLVTASEDDQNPVIMMWDLRNANAPERILSGHQGGILSLSWCKQDSDLLLSGGKDSRTICWNPNNGDILGEFPRAANWVLETSFCPDNPDLLANASFDGSITIHSLQNTRPKTQAGQTSQGTDGKDFFAQKEFSDPHADEFSLKQPPKWLRRPTGVSQGFGGNLVCFGNTIQPDGSRKFLVKITKFVSDPDVSSRARAFEESLEQGSLEDYCQNRIDAAKDENDKQTWLVLKIFTKGSLKSSLAEFLGFKKEILERAIAAKFGVLEVEKHSAPEGNKSEDKSDGLFSSADSKDFLESSTSASSIFKNETFKVFPGSISEIDKIATQAILTGEFESAIDICLKEERLSDAFMLAFCGNERCRRKVQLAYLKQEETRPAYARIIAAVVDNDLWDVVRNAELGSWKEILAIICTFSKDGEFADLCAFLGDRLVEQSNEDRSARSYASLCYLAGSRLDKVVNVWIQEVHENEEADLSHARSEASANRDSLTTIHARHLQSLIERVTVFTNSSESVKMQSVSTGKHLHILHEKYAEYADILASQGDFATAQKYISLLPDSFSAAIAMKTRIGENLIPKQVSASDSRPAGQGGVEQLSGYQPTAGVRGSYAPQFTPYAPTNPANSYGPSAPSQSQYSANPYTSQFPNQMTVSQQALPPPTGQQFMNYQPHQQMSVHTPQQPIISGTANTNPLPKPASLMTKLEGWNDVPNMPAASRRNPYQRDTQVNPQAYGHQPGVFNQLPPPQPLAPPPTNARPPQKIMSSPPMSNVQLQAQNVMGQPPTQQMNTHSETAIRNMQPPPLGPNQPTRQETRKSSGPYIPQQPSSQMNNPSQIPAQRPMMHPPPQGAPSPYIPQQASGSGPMQQTNSPYMPHHQVGLGSSQPYSPQHPPAQIAGGVKPVSIPTTQQQRPVSTPPILQSKYPPGDRSHILIADKIIFDVFNGELNRIKPVLPPQFRRPNVEAEKKLNILFDHLNNEEGISPSLLEELRQIAQSIAKKDYDTAHGMVVEALANHIEESRKWMMGVKFIVEHGRYVS